MRLGDCALGHRARVVRVDGEPTLAQRLMELGIVEGVEIEVINGEDAAKSPYAQVLAEHFQATRDHRKVRLRRRY